jgi:3-oxoacyl-(acyl-carrier-protein) synthase
MRRVAVTGIGAITPAGVDPDSLWERVRSARPCVRRIDRFDPSSYQCQVAGQADAFDPAAWLPPRLVKRTDRFTHLAMAAADSAMENAALTIGGPDGVPPERVSVMVGNVLGGWEFAERELRDLWAQGPREVSPYQATAWFPAAPQGNICIKHGIKGRARTFVCERASGAYALVHGAETIRRGQADVVLAGGSEQPLSPYAWLCCQTAGYLTRLGNTHPEAAYRPFDRRHSGTVLGEGGVFLVLENLDHARARRAPILAELCGWSLTTDGYQPYYTTEPHGETLRRCIDESMGRADIGPAELGCVVADGTAVPREDATEVLAIRAALGAHAADVPVTSVKAVTGHMMGAAAVADVAVAARAMAEGEVPPIANLEQPAAGFDLDFVIAAPRRSARLDNALVISRGLGGVNACIVLRRPAGESEER